MSRLVDEFERVVLPHAGGLLRFARRLTGDQATADDLVQETFFRAWRGFRRFERGTNGRAWVFQILVNLFRSQLRRTEARHGSLVTVDGTGASRDAHLELVEVAEAFRRLPTDQQDTLYLVIIEGFTCKEAAKILDIPIGTVMSRLSRGGEAMREALTVQIAPA